MHFSYVSLAITAFIRHVAARECTTDLNYCGFVLEDISKGDYSDQIAQNLFDSNQPIINGGRDYLFQCVGNDHGIISVIEFCGDKNCTDGGPGKNDFCRTE
ncbi:hypothetical protein MMC07_007561 [Pseudocyphellaria aurata]|nr:hypothetical protein [Pseudocyphellaria aurata]